MAQYRSISTGILQHEDVSRLSSDTFRLFIGLLLLADDEGRGCAAADFLGRAVFWGVQCPSMTRIDAMLREISDCGLAQVYCVRGRAFFELKTVGRHQQKLKNPQASTLPAPNDADSPLPPQARSGSAERMRRMRARRKAADAVTPSVTEVTGVTSVTGCRVSLEPSEATTSADITEDCSSGVTFGALPSSNIEEHASHADTTNAAVFSDNTKSVRITKGRVLTEAKGIYINCSEPSSTTSEQDAGDGATDEFNTGATKTRAKPKAKGSHATKADLLPSTLSEREHGVYEAILADSSLKPIVRRPAMLAQDLCKAGPGVNVAYEVACAGGWLRANPSKAKHNGDRFLHSWICRAQDRSGGQNANATQATPARPRNAYDVQRSPGGMDHLTAAIEKDRRVRQERMAEEAAKAAEKGEVRLDANWGI